MFDFLLNTAGNTIGEKLSIGGQVPLLGMGTVFAVLALLWGLVELLHLLLSSFSGEKKQAKTADVPVVSAPTPAPASTVLTMQTPAPIPVVSQSASDDLAIIAVITAAIAASEGRDPTTFRVVSFKRANDKFSFRK